MLSDISYSVVKETRYELAILPLGATEPHNLHLPHGTDTFEATELASRAAERATARGAKVIVLPTIPYGTETNLMQFPLAMNLQPSTLGRVIGDLVDSLAQHKIHKLLLLNSHGGNDFKPLLRELYGRTPVHLFLCDWFRGLSADIQRELFRDPGDHAGAMETAFGLAFFPDLVLRDPRTGQLAADEGSLAPVQFDAVRKGWISITRPWHLLTTNSGAGNPHEATAEQGKELVRRVVERLSDFLVDLAQAPLTERFPFDRESPSS